MVNLKGRGGGLLGHPELWRPPEHTLLSGIRLNLPLFPPGCTLGPQGSASLCDFSAQNIFAVAHAYRKESHFVIASGRASLRVRQEKSCTSQIPKHKDICFLFGLKRQFGEKILGQFELMGIMQQGNVCWIGLCASPPHTCRVKLSCCREGGSGLPWETRQRGTGLFPIWLP